MKKKMFIWSILLSAFAAGAFARPIQLSRAQAQADLDTLYSFIKEVHPDMFAVYPKEKFESEFYAFRDHLPDSVPLSDLYKESARLVARLGDGHTRVGRPDFSQIETNPVLLPLKMRVNTSDTTLYVSQNLAVDSLMPLNVEVLSINGTKAKDMLVDMMQYSSGERPFFRLAGVNGAFSALLYMLYPDKQYTIVYREEGAPSRSVTIDAIPQARFRTDLPQPQKSAAKRAPYTFDVLPGKIGLLSYNVCTDRVGFKRFADSVFTLLRAQGIEDLIIDVRDNSGGNSAVSDTLFQYISPVPYRQFGGCARKISDPVRKTYKDIDMVNGMFYDSISDLISLHENPLRYRGRCYQLISHSTFSSASSFAWAFQYFKMGRTIGEETGGQVVCFGDILSKRLPNSQLQFSVSWAKMYLYGATDTDLHGVQPDDEVPADQALEYTLGLIRSGKTR